MDVTITLTVNGRPATVTTEPQRPLLDVLREDLGLTGTKCGCCDTPGINVIAAVICLFETET